MEPTHCIHDEYAIPIDMLVTETVELCHMLEAKLIEFGDTIDMEKQAKIYTALLITAKYWGSA